MSATRASVESTGWQAVNTAAAGRRRSSSSSAASSSGRPRRCSLLELAAELLRACARAPASRRRRSMARCLAVAISQAPGLSGTPVAGHCSSAATSASCARSSARPTSRTIRARPAMSRADSIRQTASIARWTSPHAASAGPARSLPLPTARRCSRRAAAPPASRSSGVNSSPKSSASKTWRISISDSARHRVRAALDPLDRLVHRLHLPEPEAGDSSLVSANGPSIDGALVARRTRTRAPFELGCRPSPASMHAGLHQLLVELAHRGEQLLAGHDARLGVLGGLDDDHESHVVSPW